MRNRKPASVARGGFTMPEVLIASAIATVVAAGLLTVFVWVGHQATLCAKIAWSQNEAMKTSSQIMMYVRNAKEIVTNDVSQGTWVQLRFGDGSAARLVYSNDMPRLRDGRIYLVRSNGTELIVARGLTEIQNSSGYTTPVFTKTRDNSLRIAYRVAEPASSGARDANDGPYAAAVRFAVALRNFDPSR